MNKNRISKFTLAVGSAAVAVVIAGTACAKQSGNGSESKSSEAGVVTNDNGSVSRTYVESTVTTNGNMVTEHRRETRTTLDTEGNMLATSTSEYAQSYPVGDVWGAEKPALGEESNDRTIDQSTNFSDSFLSLKFGEEFKGNTNFVADADEPTLLRTVFTPKKALAGFDDYYVYVTPASHKVAKVYACAKNAIEPGARWRRHYLIEALEKRYQTWARLCSFSRPCYAFDLGCGRHVTACLADSSRDYETVLVGWDDAILAEAAEETAAIREAARKSAAEKRANRVNDAAAAF